MRGGDCRREQALWNQKVEISHQKAMAVSGFQFQGQGDLVSLAHSAVVCLKPWSGLDLNFQDRSILFHFLFLFKKPDNFYMAEATDSVCSWYFDGSLFNLPERI